ncbi:FecR family protein [Cyclobacterium jeungdonense]|uniref:FecR domain-containing protein n=1 Tax=Cyclobacterium jeungdonense TaxID=708087 RepID=A0ABT8C0F6_9BACT|nr:FecR domain-containing protein [Cyclobacterium jeungdonense]MDN3686244.1 FecR domain-containing protein [Cyclobacterium jeungdonense]
MEWLAEDGAEDAFIGMLQRNWKSGKSSQVKELKQRQLLERIHQATLKSRKGPEGKQIFGLFLRFGRIAATFLLVAFSSFYLYEAFFRTKAVETLTEVAPRKIQKHTSAGEKLKLTLPDQSKVIVNSLSSITFYSDFGISTREVELEGEAFFSIAPDNEKPFMVKTGTVKMTALGTAFNTYAREEEVKISLTEGRVNVVKEKQVLSLVPGEMASVIKGNVSALTKEKFDPMVTTLWKEGKIRFQSKPFKEILQTLENWYGVRFETQAFANRKVTGLFNNESLEDILTGLSFSLGFEYQINQKNVLIKF